MVNEDELFKEGEFRQKLGPNIIEQFVKSHDLIGMIAELFQNDFDAKSRKTKIHFLEDRLIVNGYGVKIDKKGWKRLSYWLGVGQESEKKGGIGKKNFGLRSLFLISNMLIISSGGYKTALDVKRGARQKKIKETVIYQENSSFRLEAEYRTEPLGKLSIFTKEREEELFASLRKYLPSFIQFLVCSKKQKLCTIKDGQILFRPYEIEIISDRLDTSIICHVKMWEDKHIRGLLNRKIDQKVIENGKIKSDKSRITEILLPIERFSNMSMSEIPDYYLSKDKKKVITGISFAVDKKGKNPLVTHGGLFYPIRMRDQYTGLGFSLNAPFLLDMDRDRIVHDDDWNEYLLTQTGKELGKIFSTKILPKYGPKTYLLFISDNIDNAYSEFYENALKSLRQYIINDHYDPKKKVKKKHFCELNDQREPNAYLPSKLLNGKVIPIIDFYPVVVSHTGKEQAISRHLAKFLMSLDENILQDFLDNFKIKTFTIHNICELLINDGKKHHTFSEDGGWHYTSRESFEKDFSDIDYIKLHLDTLHKYWDLLTKEEIVAIKESDWLQAADSTPQGFNDLSLWEGDIREFIWPEKDSIIHPKLAKHPIFRRRMFKLSPFNIIEKIEEKAEEWEVLEDNEKEVIFKFIVKNWKFILGEKWRETQHITKELTKIRKIFSDYPLLKDSNEEWVNLQDLKHVDKRLRAIFGSSLHYPHKNIPKRFLQALKVPTKLRLPADIIKRCNELENVSKEEIFTFEEYLSKGRYKEAVKKQIYENLWSVCTIGGEECICKTKEAYIPYDDLKNFLGTTLFPYLFIRNDAVRKFYHRIGVAEKPRFEDMVKYLNQLQQTNRFLRDRTSFYKELINAAEREELAKAELSVTPIILIGLELYCPEKVIISKNMYKYFKRGIRYWPESKINSELRDSLKRLGCKEKLVKDNIIDFLTWVAEKYENNENVGSEEREGIHLAYLELKSFPEEKMADDKKIFLSKSGKLFSKEQIEKGLLVLDDMPELSVELKENDIEIEFADYGEGREFIDSVGTKPLSSLIDDEKAEPGAKLSEDKVLTRKISARYLKNALISADIQEFKGIMDHEKIKDMKKAFVYNEIIKIYTVNSIEIKLPDKAGIKWDEDVEGYILCVVKGQRDNFIIAKELSSFLINNPVERHRAIDFIIILLSHENEQQILEYLKFKNIDYINYFKPTVEDYGEEPYDDTDEEEDIDEDQLEEDDEESEEEEEDETDEEDEEKGETPSKLPRKRQRRKKRKDSDIEEEIKNRVDPDEEDETIEELKRKKGSTEGEYTPTFVKKRPKNVIHLQKQIKRKYKKCQICGLPIFEGKEQLQVYGHLRGHHIIPWQEKSTAFDGLLCLCQPHHHMFHHAKEVIFRIRKNNKTIEVFVNGKREGNISIIKGHDVLEYFLENLEEIERHSENIKIEILE